MGARTMADTTTTLVHYLLAFVVFGLAGTLTYWLGERSSSRTMDSVREVTAAQTIELTETMMRGHGLVQKLDSLSSALDTHHPDPDLVDQLRSGTRDLVRVYQDWADANTRRAALIGGELKATDLSAKVKAQEFSEIVTPYYAFFVESLEQRLAALQDAGNSIEIRRDASLPDPIVEAREPVISGGADFLGHYTFAGGRKWTLIVSTGGASPTELRLPYLWIALAEPGAPDHGPNYFQIHMELHDDLGLTYSILSNFDSVRSRVQVERQPISTFRERIDKMLETLLALELGYAAK